MAKSAKKIGKMVTADVDKALANIGSMRPEIKVDETINAAAAPSRDLSFAERFKYARMAAKAAGLDPSKQTFTHNGKSYSTKMAGEGASKPAASSSSGRSGTGSSGVSAATSKFFNKLPTIQSTVSGMRGNPPAASRPATPAAPATSRPAANSQSQRYNTRAAELNREMNEERAAEKAKGSAGARARLKNLFGFGSDAAERAAKSYTRMAEGAGRQERALASKPKSRPLLLTGDEARKANAKARFESGTLFRAKGGKIDGCAVRGKTRAMKKGK
jgi:hypothetical protein